MSKMKIHYSGEKFIHANEIELCYDTFGEKTDPPLLLIMGFSSQMVTWEKEFCEAIASQGYFVIRYDNRDVGLSTKFDHTPVPNVFALIQGEVLDVPYKLIDMAKDAIGLLDALDIDKAHICGASMGGMIAQTIAIHFPERVRSLISIMSTTGDPTLPQASPEAMNVLIAPPQSERQAHIQQGIETWKILNGGVLPFDEELARKRVARAYDRSFYPEGAGRQLAAIIASGSRKEELNSVIAPSLIIHGDADPLIPIEGGEDTANSIPKAKFMKIEGMGHNIPVEIVSQIITAIVTHIRGTTTNIGQ
jgi:pimeloyl-ACP methyl ester carboxylesterase